MNVWVVNEENHDGICYAISFRAAKQYLLDSGWVTGCSRIWDEKLKKNQYLGSYGENWRDIFLQFDYDELENMGFYITKERLIEEEK